MNKNLFKNPEATFRPAPFWSWNGDLQKKELQRQINEMAKKGWGGFFMHSRVGLITPYLSKEWHELVRVCAIEAKKTGTVAWLYDEDKWPSGYAGGIVPEENPEYRMKALAHVPKGLADPLTMTVLKSVVVEGRELDFCRYHSPLGSPNFNGASYIDTLNPEAVKRFLEITVDGYQKEVGEFFGKEIPGIFTDEPCYIFHERELARSLPWTDKLPDFFHSIKGYAIVDHLESLFYKVGDWRKIRYDFFDVNLRLFIESFSKQYHAKCKKANLIFTGHFMAEDTLEEQTRWIGAAMPHYEHMDWPGIDKLSRHTEQAVTVKQVSSVADQLGKERTFCEVFGCTGHQFHFQGRRWIHNWEAALGINFVNHHLSLYTMAGERKRDYPPNFFYQQPYWPYENGISDYLGRVNYLLTQGKRDVEVLVLHPIASAWAEYDVIGYFYQLGTKSKWSAAFNDLSMELLSHRIDFHYGDEIIMENHASVKKDKLKIGNAAYKIIVVPPSLTWRQSTFDLLKVFYDSGGQIIFTGIMPTYIEMHKTIDYKKEFPKAYFVNKHSEVSEKIKNLRQNIVKVVDIDTGANASMVYIHERTLENESRIIFLTNISENKPVNAEITFSFEGSIKQFDLDHGLIVPISTKTENGITTIFYVLEAGSALALQLDPTVKVETQKLITSNFEEQRILDWSCEALDLNVLRVETASLTLNGKIIGENSPLLKLWQPFYESKDGSPFEAEYKFMVNSTPKGKMEVVIEYAENLDRIEINGNKIKAGKKTWLDIHFNAIDITKYVVKGLNSIKISGKKINNITDAGFHRRVLADEFPYKTTELENIYIIGDFLVSDFGRTEFCIESKPKNHAPDVRNLTIEGYPFYAGRFKLVADFKAKTKESVELEFSDIGGACLDIYVNGKNAEVLYWAPWKTDISKFVKKGKNKLEVILPTDLLNLMGPNQEPIGLPPRVGPPTYRAANTWAPKLLLQRIGIGAARVKASKL
jgi:hypothetical protein